MNSKNNVNRPVSLQWYRCKRVEFTGETATWELSRTGEYSLVAAYKEEPHRDLIQAIDDDSLRVFVKKWGPLRLTLNEWTGSDPLPIYRRERDLLRAWALLFDAIRKREGLREAAIQLLRLDSEPYGIWIRSRLGITGALNAVLDEVALDRVARTTESECLDLCNFLVGSLSIPAPSLQILGKGRAMELRPTMRLYSLPSALNWMVWQDVFSEKPFGFCPECGTFIDFTTKHDKEFCNNDCAHRKAARESARRKREEKRKSGTQKTR